MFLSVEILYNTCREIQQPRKFSKGKGLREIRVAPDVCAPKTSTLRLHASSKNANTATLLSA
jgi:hypothetical protein